MDALGSDFAAAGADLSGAAAGENPSGNRALPPAAESAAGVTGAAAGSAARGAVCCIGAALAAGGALVAGCARAGRFQAMAVVMSTARGTVRKMR